MELIHFYHVSETLTHPSSRCKRVDPGDPRVQWLLLRPEHIRVQGGEGGQRRPFLLRGQLLCPGGGQDGRVQQHQRYCSL